MIDLILKGSEQSISCIDAINMAVQSCDCTAGFVIYRIFMCYCKGKYDT